MGRAIAGGFRDYVEVKNDVAKFDSAVLEDLTWYVNRCLNNGFAPDELCAALYILAVVYRDNDVGDVVKYPKGLFKNALALIDKYSQASDFDEYDCFQDVIENAEI